MNQSLGEAFRQVKPKHSVRVVQQEAITIPEVIDMVEILAENNRLTRLVSSLEEKLKAKEKPSKDVTVFINNEEF